MIQFNSPLSAFLHWEKVIPNRVFLKQPIEGKTITYTFEEAGIEASSELASAMEDAGFDAQKVGTRAGVGGSQAQGGMTGPPPSGGGGGQMSSSEAEEVFDILDTNEDGTVSLSELEEYYGTSSDENASTELSANQQNALDNLQLLMETIKSSNTDDSETVDSSSFDGLLNFYLIICIKNDQKS